MNTERPLVSRDLLADVTLSVLPESWPVSMHPEGPASGQQDTGHPGFPSSSSRYQDSSIFKLLL